MMHTFPSTEWFQMLADCMAAQPEKYAKLGPVDLTLIVRIVHPDERSDTFRLVFKGHACRAVERLDGDLHALDGPHTVIMEGPHAAWSEMVDNIRTHGSADREHTLNYLTLPDWPLRLVPSDGGDGQLEVDRFYRYIESLQEFFNEAVNVQTRYAA